MRLVIILSFGIICFKTNKIGIININILIMFKFKNKICNKCYEDIDIRPYNQLQKFLLTFSKLKAF